MNFNFLPREFDFFNLFEEQVDCAVQSAIKFKEIAAPQGLLKNRPIKRSCTLRVKGTAQAMPSLNSSTNLLSLLLTVKISMPLQKSWMTLRT